MAILQHFNKEGNVCNRVGCVAWPGRREPTRFGFRVAAVTKPQRAVELRWASF